MLAVTVLMRLPWLLKRQEDVANWLNSSMYRAKLLKLGLPLVPSHPSGCQM